MLLIRSDQFLHIFDNIKTTIVMISHVIFPFLSYSQALFKLYCCQFFKHELPTPVEVPFINWFILIFPCFIQLFQYLFIWSFHLYLCFSVQRGSIIFLCTYFSNIFDLFSYSIVIAQVTTGLRYIIFLASFLFLFIVLTKLTDLCYGK